MGLLLGRSARGLGRCAADLAEGEQPGDDAEHGVGVPVVGGRQDGHEEGWSEDPAQPGEPSERHCYGEQHGQPWEQDDEDQKPDAVNLPEVHVRVLSLKGTVKELYHGNIRSASGSVSSPVG